MLAKFEWSLLGGPFQIRAGVKETPYIEYTGNEPQDAESQYFAYAMVMQFDESRKAIREHFAEVTLAELRSLPPTSVQPLGGVDYQQAKTRFET